MRQHRRHILAALGAILLTSTTMSAHAAPGKSRGVPSFDRAQMQSSFATPNKTRNILAQRVISASEAKSIALGRVRGGEVVDISRKGNTYRVRVIAKNGKVVDVYIDATTGRVKR